MPAGLADVVKSMRSTYKAYSDAVDAGLSVDIHDFDSTVSASERAGEVSSNVTVEVWLIVVMFLSIVVSLTVAVALQTDKAPSRYMSDLVDYYLEQAPNKKAANDAAGISRALPPWRGDAKVHTGAGPRADTGHHARR
ncbi:hypothetical protein G6F65_019385 [Rhizopus arrhizus]|nr:hypothetical protein G6F65_019385 [Rhizopus arrhizus]KAG1249168.1 hypothetical protein G6F68_013482 [Rhizopus microsporus]